MKRLLLLSLCLIFFCMNVFAGNSENTEEYNTISKTGRRTEKIFLDALEKYSVSIFSVNPGIGVCSGVVIKKNENNTYVLTAKHCVNRSEEMYVENLKVEIIITSTSDDLAYLIVKGSIDNKESASINKSNEPIKNKIYFVGYPSFTKKYKSAGKIVRYDSDWGYAHLKSIRGASGSGLFNNDSKLIGILWGGFGDITIFETAKDIKKFIEDINLISKNEK